MSAPEPLDQVLADARGELPVYRRAGADAVADAIERLCDRVAEVTEEFRRFVPESTALMRTGWALRKLRRWFRVWESQGHARWDGQHREYRLLVLPQRANPSAAYEAGRRDGRAA